MTLRDSLRVLQFACFSFFPFFAFSKNVYFLIFRSKFWGAASMSIARSIVSVRKVIYGSYGPVGTYTMDPMWTLQSITDL